MFNIIGGGLSIKSNGKKSAILSREIGKLLPVHRSPSLSSITDLKRHSIWSVQSLRKHPVVVQKLLSVMAIVVARRGLVRLARHTVIAYR